MSELAYRTGITAKLTVQGTKAPKATRKSPCAKVRSSDTVRFLVCYVVELASLHPNHGEMLQKRSKRTLSPHAAFRHPQSMKMDSIRFMIDSACAGRRPVIFGAASPLLSCCLTEIFGAGTRQVHGDAAEGRKTPDLGMEFPRSRNSLLRLFSPTSSKRPLAPAIRPCLDAGLASQPEASLLQGSTGQPSPVMVALRSHLDLRALIMRSTRALISLWAVVMLGRNIASAGPRIRTRKPRNPTA